MTALEKRSPRLTNLKLFMKEVSTIVGFVTVVRLFESSHRFKTLQFRHQVLAGFASLPSRALTARRKINFIASAHTSCISYLSRRPRLF